VFINEKRTFTGLFFQDALMKNNFNCYPEIVLFNATYKLNEFCMPLYLMLVVDGNGHSKIVSMYLTSTETKTARTDMIEAFKSANQCRSKIGV